MARSAQIIDILKKELRTQGINYKTLAEKLSLSESTIKHMFSSKNFSLKRLDAICELLGIEMTDLTTKLEATIPKIEQVSLKTEKELVSDIQLLMVAYCVTNHWAFEDILRNYTITETQCIRCLVMLDKMKFIELQPDNQIKLLISNSFKWHPNGPIEQFFREQVQERFFNSSFKGHDECRVVKIGDLSDKSIQQLINKINAIGDLYDELNTEDRKQPFDNRRGSSMVLAIRKWQFNAFSQFER